MLPPDRRPDEVDHLLQRIADLEAVVAEYRTQMSEVLGSASWRVTSPLRAIASRSRRLRVRLRRTGRRLRARRARGAGPEALPTAGLFAPAPDALPASSPLRRAVDFAGLRRAPEADGPVTPVVRDARLAVVAHVHYAELWDDIDSRLSRMPEPYDLIITVTEGVAESAIPRMREHHPTARIEVVPNRGRDWAPIVELANRGLLNGYAAIAKVHTKKSEHRKNGDGWRIALLDGIFESPEQITRIVDLLVHDRSVGLVVPTGHVDGAESWFLNEQLARALAARLPMAFDPDSLQFPSGSMFWCRPFVLQRLADLAIDTAHFELEAGQHDQTTAHAVERLTGLMASAAGLDIIETGDVKARLSTARRTPDQRPTVLAFYLPQYHPIAENDEFWGPGFTDWVNVREGMPQFRQHRQPLLPADSVGYYDPRQPEVLRAQSRLARDYGIDGFVAHHYWFDGRSLLDAPIRTWLAHPDIDLPLALCWANEPWTRRWDGLPHDVLIEQSYGPGWARRFWDDIVPYLRDPRYLRIAGRPLLVVYRVGGLPHPLEAIDTWRRLATEEGWPGLHLLGVHPPRELPTLSAEIERALDGIVPFPPGSGIQPRRIADFLDQAGGGATPPIGDAMRDRVFAYGAGLPGGPTIGRTDVRGVMPGWDNTSRMHDRGYVFHGASPAAFRGVLRRALHRSTASTLLVVNAWNEWAEAAALEPSARFGRGNLEAIHDAVGTRPCVTAPTSVPSASTGR